MVGPGTPRTPESSRARRARRVDGAEPGDHASGAIACIGFTHGFAQMGARVTAARAEEHGLICLDLQLGCLWNDDRCLAAIRRVEGPRTTEPAFSTEQLAWFDDEVTTALAFAGFEPWVDSAGLEAWRISLPGVGGAVEVQWSLVGQHLTDPNVHYYLRVRNELIEQLMAWCPTADPPRGDGLVWTLTTPLHQATHVFLPSRVSDTEGLEDLVARLASAGADIRKAVAGCARPNGVEGLGALDYQRRTIAWVLEGRTAEAVTELNGLVRRLVPEGRRAAAEDTILFLEWVQQALPAHIAHLDAATDLPVQWHGLSRMPGQRPTITDEQRQRFGLAVR